MIVVANETGLCSRIKNVVSALRRSHIKDDFVVLDNFDHEYSFSLKQIASRSLKDQDWYATWMLEDIVPDTKLLIDDSKEIVIINQYGAPTILKNTIDFQYENITIETREKWIKYFNLLEWNPYVLAEVERLYDTLNLQNTVAVHIRSWYEDNIKKAVCGLYDIQMYVDVIESLGVDRIFLCADHVKVVSDLKQCLNPNIQIITRENLLPAQRHIEFDKNIDILVYATVDLLLLSKFDTIIGSYQSNFTEVAWWIGQCKAKTIIPVPPCVNEERLKYNL